MGTLREPRGLGQGWRGSRHGASTWMRLWLLIVLASPVTGTANATLGVGETLTRDGRRKKPPRNSPGWYLRDSVALH